MVQWLDSVLFNSGWVPPGWELDAPHAGAAKNSFHGPSTSFTSALNILPFFRGTGIIL